MAKAPYQPPVQSKLGQTFDTLFLLVLVMASLFVPLYLGLAGGGKTTLELKDQTWAGMGQNATMQAQWEKLGYTQGAKTDANPTSAADLISARFDYTFEPLELVLTALVVIGYFFIVFHWSKKEYREVIDERFNNK
ncbi:hypothetical protein [uncultured Hyphomicrobium sp.]|uniref:hypothetical protein n=1 Tax=uncultured Hyphomicrobium sp. TaxID=194373 RepID=UPI0025F5EAAC|nr:hypothetical protein [uncultured Hyphomicrobium sp.]